MGDRASLLTSVLGRFDTASIESAKKKLWSSQESVLSSGGLSLLQRRDSEKRRQSVADLDDILSAFDMLDEKNCIPAMYCEAKELLLLPPLSLDPVSEQLRSNTSSLDAVSAKVDSLEAAVSASLSSLQVEIAKHEVSRTTPSLELNKAELSRPPLIQLLFLSLLLGVHSARGLVSPLRTGVIT